ncbi:hypothetical protein [Streptomyces sp. SPB78]|uniref:hypothetical protein n=1 Tax=Streptomyces sp. (strain SPB78) TaxID=591157 RepID=UPI0001B5536F|nr:hypothetical protein [Streptomyces sp. SPB78]
MTAPRPSPAAPPRRLRFDGWIAGLGTASGTRLVLGHWPRSPFGPFSDVMVAFPDGRRVLLAPRADVAEFVAATYRFEEVRVVPVDVVRDGRAWSVTAGPLRLRLRAGHRTPLGAVLRAVPLRLATHPAWARLTDLPARLLPGVRTYGTAGNGRREWYAAHDMWGLAAAGARWDGADLGRPGPLAPPPHFGFEQTPRWPCLVRVVSTVELPG